MGVALVTKFLAGVQKEMRQATGGRVRCAQRISCCKATSSKWTDSGWLVVIVSVQALIFYVLGLALFLLFECVAGQESNFYIEQDVNGTSWLSLDCGVGLLCINNGPAYIAFCLVRAWQHLFLIDAITDFVKSRSINRWKIHEDLMLDWSLRVRGAAEDEDAEDEDGVLSPNQTKERHE